MFYWTIELIGLKNNGVWAKGLKCKITNDSTKNKKYFDKSYMDSFQTQSIYWRTGTHTTLIQSQRLKSFEIMIIKRLLAVVVAFMSIKKTLVRLKWNI